MTRWFDCSPSNHQTIFLNMNFYFLLTLIPFLFSPPSHDIPMGVFNLTFEEDKIRMDIKFELEDIEKGTSQYFKKKSTDRLVEQYILQHTSWSINDQPLIPKLCSTEKLEDHYFLKMDFALPAVPLTKMTITNNCLLEVINKQSNIIYIQQYGEQRGFRLHKDRTQTSFELM